MEVREHGRQTYLHMYARTHTLSLRQTAQTHQAHQNRAPLQLKDECKDLKQHVLWGKKETCNIMYLTGALASKHVYKKDREREREKKNTSSRKEIWVR